MTPWSIHQPGDKQSALPLILLSTAEAVSFLNVRCHYTEGPQAPGEDAGVDATNFNLDTHTNSEDG